MTPIRDRFYFRLESERWAPLSYCVIYYRRENKRWWQREFVRFTDRLWWGEDEDGTPDAFAAKVLDEQMRENEKNAKHYETLAAYRDLKPVKTLAD